MCESSSSVLPRAVISRSALAAGAIAAVSAGGRVADLRRDAWGHGLLGVAQAVAAAGAQAVLVDGPREAEVLEWEGIRAVSSGEADIDPALLFGFPDADGMLPHRPVLRLAGRVLSSKPLRAGEGVSYGYTYRAPEDTVVALVTGGYAQGIVRGLGNSAHAEVDGTQRPIVGRVAMDVCVVDLEGHDVPDGTEVTYFGGDGPAAPALSRWSRVTGLSIGELVTVAGSHAVREWEG